MAVYVDPPMTWNERFKDYCHMYADSVDELHQFAAQLGLKRSWFQNSSDHPHYDISLNKRRLAIWLGAIETTHEHIVTWMRANRTKKG